MADEKKDQVVAYVVRHGTTKLNEENRFRGQKDIPLDETGQKDTEELAKFFADKQIGQAWTSPLMSSKDTAKKRLQGRQVKVTPAKQLLPLDAGKSTGMTQDDPNAKI